MLITGILIFVIFTRGGAAISLGKQHWLIAGQVTMPRGEAENGSGRIGQFHGKQPFGTGRFALIDR